MTLTDLPPGECTSIPHPVNSVLLVFSPSACPDLWESLIRCLFLLLRRFSPDVGNGPFTGTNEVRECLPEFWLLIASWFYLFIRLTSVSDLPLKFCPFESQYLWWIIITLRPRTSGTFYLSRLCDKHGDLFLSVHFRNVRETITLTSSTASMIPIPATVTMPSSCRTTMVFSITRFGSGERMVMMV